MPGQASVNHVFRTIWNQALGAMVAVAEIASSAGGGTGSAAREARVGLNMDDEAPPLRAMALSILLAFSAFAAHTQTLPSGGVAVHGGAAFNTSQPNRLTVTTTNGANSSHSAINWNSFSIGSGNTTNFLQPNAASLSINRVVTNTPSQLFGTLSSNGKLVLVNQSGIAVGAGALVDTAGFTASALGMSQADAIAGRLRFAAGGAGLTVDGNIFARGGDVVLIAPNVDVAKTALIESQGGSVVLAAGQSVEVTGRGLEGITLQVQAPTDQAINLGTLKGDAVGIFAGTLRHSGMIQAVQANMEGGKVVLRALGDAYVEGQGQINATSAVGKGGSVDVLGQRVAVMDDAVIDVSGHSGGGTVRVGGDYQGGNPNVPNADISYLGPKAVIKADATGDGQGGRVIVWADDTTRAYGNISAQGGTQGGDGGFVEVSGHRYLDFQGQVNTLAPLGKAGTLLLDPAGLTIDNTTNSGGGTVGSVFTAGAANSTLTWATINTLLSSGGLQVRTNQGNTGPGAGDLVVAAGTTLTGTGFLNLVAHNDLIFNPGVAVTGPGDYSLIAGWNNTGLAVTPFIGNITFGAGSSLSTPGTLFFNAGNSVNQDPSSVITANRLGIGNTNPQPLPGGVAMPGANLVGTLAVGLANTTSLAGFFFNNAQNLTIGNASFFSGIDATGNPQPINVTSTGTLTVSSPITTGGSNLTLTGNTGIAVAANITANILNLNSSAGNGSVVQSGGSIVTSVTSVTAGTGNVTMNSAGNSSGIFGIPSAGAVNVTNGANTLNLISSNAASFTLQSQGFIGSGGGTITTTGGAIDIRSLGTGINLNLDGAMSLNSAAGIKLEAVGNVRVSNSALIANAGGDIKIGSTSGLLNAAFATETRNGGGRWLTYLTNPVAGHTFGPFSPTGFGTNFRQVNAPIGTAPIGAGNGSLWSDTGAPTGTLTGSVTKVFDGSNTISLAGATLVPSGGYLFGETGGSFLPGATGSLVNPNVGVGKAVTATALPLTGVQLVSTLTTPTYGYVLTSASGNIGAVTPAALSVITLGGKRVYDGTNIVNADIFALSGLIGTQTLTLAGAGTVADKNIGVAKPVTLGSLALGNGTGLASNYTLAGGVHVATITPVNISISGLAASSKVYDGTTAAVVSTASAALTGTISGDSVGFSGGTGTFQDKNAGVGKTVGISGLALVGADAGNYNLVSSSTVAVADIFKASISGVTGITASNKVYDGKTVATLVTGSALVTGIVSGESVSVNGATGNFSDKNAGTGKTVAITGISLAGTDAGNYTLGTGNATAVADISKATISDVAGITARNKVYDATTAASINTAGATLVGAVAGDALGVSATGQFVDKNAGIGKTVNVSSITLTGPGAVNYTVAKANSTTSADISKASIGSVSGITASDKVYDGNTKATLSGSAASLGGVIGGDSVTIAGIAGEFTDRNVGSDKTVNINGGSLSGADGGNYSLSGGTAPVKASISVRPLSIWTAATGGQWSTAANWDALPDGNNVLAVSIPAGAGTVVLDANAGAVNLQSLSSQRPVLISGGALALRSDLSLASLGQTGGALAGTGGLTVSDNFRQTGGSMVFARDVAINQATGNLVVGEIGAPSVALSAPLGSIGQTAALTTPSLVTLSATGSLLTDAANRVNLFRASNTGAGDIALNNAVPLDVAGIRNADGNVVIKSTGGVNTSGLVTAPGVVSISANSPLRVGSDGIVAGDDVILVATNLTSAGNILINGPITSGGKVKINAGNNLTQNSVIFGAKGVTVDAGGVITFGPNAVAGRQPVVYSLAGVEVAPPLSGAQARANAAALPDSIVAFLDLFGRAQKRERADLGNVGETASNRRRNRDAIVAEEQTCRP